MNRSRFVEHKQILLVLLMAAFIFITIAAYLGTILINPTGQMIYPRYVPENIRVGNDTFLDYKFAKRYFVDHKSAYISDNPEHWYTQNAYPPLFTLYWYPIFLLNTSWQSVYRYLYVVIIAFFLLYSLFLPIFYHKKFEIPGVLIFVAATGITSYGLQFALERGQFDVISVSMCLLSVYMFWYLPKLRWLAYILFFVAFQFKIYPFIFILCFIDAAQGWKKNLLRIGGISAAVFLSLFVMGVKGFFEFLKALTYQTKSGVYTKDHGLNFGVDYLLGVNNILLPENQVYIIKAIVFLIGLIMLGYIFFHFLRNQKTGFFPPLLFACLLFSMALFPASKDYKLPLLAGGFGVYTLYLSRLQFNKMLPSQILIYLCYLGIALSYSITLYSYAYRPVALQNSFIFVYGTLILVAIIQFIIEKTKIPVSSGPALNDSNAN